MEDVTFRSLLDQIVPVREEMKGLGWWEGEDRFQIIVETIGTHGCTLIDTAVWSYDLKLLADEATGGNMLSIVERELDDWIKNAGSNWDEEAGVARREKRDWSRTKIGHLRNGGNRRASVAARSLWAWYGKEFPKRDMPQFVTTKEWTKEHKEWLVQTEAEDIQRELNFKIRFWRDALTGIRDFIAAESEGKFAGLSETDAIGRLRDIHFVGGEKAPKIALFYFGLPFVIFDAYLLRVGQRHGWLPRGCDKWNDADRSRFEKEILNALSCLGRELRGESLKALHTVVNDCGNLYCEKKGPRCDACPLRRFLTDKTEMVASPMPMPCASSDGSGSLPLPASMPNMVSCRRSRASLPGIQYEIIDAILGAYPHNLDGRWLSATDQVELLRLAYDAVLPDGRNAFPAMHGGADRGNAARYWDRKDRTNRMKYHVRQGHAIKFVGQNSYMLASGVAPAALGVSQEVVDALASYNIIPRYDVNTASHVTPRP